MNVGIRVFTKDGSTPELERLSPIDVGYYIVVDTGHRITSVAPGTTYTPVQGVLPEMTLRVRVMNNTVVTVDDQAKIIMLNKPIKKRRKGK